MRSKPYVNTTPVVAASRALSPGFVATLLLAMLCCALFAPQSLAQQDQAQRSIAVQGRGSVTALPDEARLNFTVSERGLQLQALRKAVNERSNRVLAHLRKQGIADAQISASGISLRPEYRWDQQRREQELVGYVLERQVSARLLDLERLAAVIEGAADAGANQISAPELGHSEAPELMRQALAAAARDARANAQSIATALGVTLGEARSINASHSPQPRPMAENMMLRAAASDSAGPAAEYLTGELRFESVVQASFAISGGATAEVEDQ